MTVFRAGQGRAFRQPFFRLRAALARTWLHPRRLGAWYQERLVAAAFPRERKVKRLLDIGCGRRPYEPMLRPHVVDYLGVDLPGRFEAERGPDIFADACSLPFRSGIADVILCTEVIEHVPDPDLLLREAPRVIAEGGTLILSAPFFEPLHEEPYDYTRYTAFGLKAFAERAGFRVREVKRRGGWWAVVLGSLIGQALYDTVAPRTGTRRRRTPGILLVLPVLVLLQFLALTLDSFFRGKRVAIGYLLVAEPKREPLMSEKRSALTPNHGSSNSCQ
ncbi:MAG: class I SAM-dependent methyltransferase [Chloroflexota bacterium]|nr:class I SAM-dependent methyltransferase [Dehalococcoidia bacterium]MDW8252647.1 class I SAM-dependent methyltransferase [Chloroflexota bacterium]